MDETQLTIGEQISKHWEQEQVPVADAVVFADGRVLVLQSSTWTRDGQVRASVRMVAESRLESVLQFDSDPWMSVEIQCQDRCDGRPLQCFAGGGMMGNEGFVALTDATRQPLWLAGFVRSNPFPDIRFETTAAGLFVVATSTYEQEWWFPVDDPAGLEIRDEPSDASMSGR